MTTDQFNRLTGSKGKQPPKKRSNSGRRWDIPDVKGGSQDGLFVRSSWEANVARICMFQKKSGLIYDWLFESIEFEFPVKRGCRTYIPDFTIYDTSSSEPRYLEVKGYMDQKSRTKLKRMGKYFPGIRVDIIAAKEMRRLSKSYKGIIENWEGA